MAVLGSLGAEGCLFGAAVLDVADGVDIGCEEGYSAAKARGKEEVGVVLIGSSKGNVHLI